MYYICSCRTIVNMDSFLVDGRNFQVVLCPLKYENFQKYNFKKTERPGDSTRHQLFPITLKQSTLRR